MIDEPTEEDERHMQIGERWEADSSLEKWFPFTAMELKRLQARVRELEEAMPRASMLAAMERSLYASYGDSCEVRYLGECASRIDKVMKR